MSAHIGAYMGVRVHTVDELHRKMGYISPAVIKQLIEQKVVLGLKLDVKSEAISAPHVPRLNPLANRSLRNESNMSPRH